MSKLLKNTTAGILGLCLLTFGGVVAHATNNTPWVWHDQIFQLDCDVDRIEFYRAKRELREREIVYLNKRSES